MQFVVTAMDFADEDALNRRMTHREAHLEGVKKLLSEGKFISGGAILDDNDRMIGSTLHLDFPDKESLEQHLQNDPYVSGSVWENIDVRPARFVPVN